MQGGQAGRWLCWEGRDCSGINRQCVSISTGGNSIDKHYSSKKGHDFTARSSGGPKRPTSPTHGAAGENLRDMQEMVHDLDIMHHLPHTP